MIKINKEIILFYYDKHSLYVKIFILFLICIFFIGIYITFALLLFDVPPKNLFIFFYLIVCTIFSHIILITRYISELKYFLKVSSEKITYYYYILDPFISEIDFYWINIIAIEKISGLISNKICITYKDDLYEKIKKKKIKIHNSEIPYDEIYDILVDKWNEYKNQSNKIK